jgi:hypothetical protein
MYIEPVNTNQVKVAACCQAVPSLATVNELNFQSNTALTALRQDFDNSIRSEDCHRCWRLEDLGAESRRKNMIDEYHTRDTAVELKSLDINVTWACNLACVMCGPQWSSTWSKELGTNETELKQLGRKSQKANPFMDQLDLTQLERVHFNGGEPLINNNHLDVLQRLHNCGSLSKTVATYNTNGTVFPSDAVIDMWKQAKLVKLYFSIDATDQAFEYVRWPAKWLGVENNIKHMIDTLPSNVMFGLNVTVGCYNIFEITDVWNWFNETIRTNREGDPTDFCWQLAYNYDIKQLPHNAKIDAIARLSAIDTYQGIVSHLQAHINYNATQDWTEQLTRIDSRRGTCWNKILTIGKYY